jgi:iron complex transport system ATP-binding protein
VQQRSVMAILELSGIAFVRDGVTILDGVDWRVRKGEHWAVLGANGSGKTTLLKIITAYEWPTRGTVEVLGRHFGECDVRALRKEIGWVSSSLEHRLPGHDAAVDVVMSGLEASLGIYRPFGIVERAKGLAALAAMGAAQLAPKRYGILSQGEQQRVLIARALVAGPALLILDEPCAGLDPAARARFLDDLEKLGANGGPGMILVTHHIEEIGPWVNRVLALKDGRVMASGEPEHVLRGEVLSELFSMRCAVRRNGRFYTLQVASGP